MTVAMAKKSFNQLSMVLLSVVRLGLSSSCQRICSMSNQWTDQADDFIVSLQSRSNQQCGGLSMINPFLAGFTTWCINLQVEIGVISPSHDQSHQKPLLEGWIEKRSQCLVVQSSHPQLWPPPWGKSWRMSKPEGKKIYIRWMNSSFNLHPPRLMKLVL